MHTYTKQLPSRHTVVSKRSIDTVNLHQVQPHLQIKQHDLLDSNKPATCLLILLRNCNLYSASQTSECLGLLGVMQVLQKYSMSFAKAVVCINPGVIEACEL